LDATSREQGQRRCLSRGGRVWKAPSREQL
jgi:hypothetical protein